MRFIDAGAIDVVFILLFGDEFEQSKRLQEELLPLVKSYALPG
jgi:hypothetical protein